MVTSGRGHVEQGSWNPSEHGYYNLCTNKHSGEALITLQLPYDFRYDFLDHTTP